MSPESIQPHRKGESFASPLSESNVTLSDIEQCYDIGRVVGDGNFAVVRECRRRDDGQTLALKIIERSKLVGREHMMQNELSLLGSLCHPRIVRLYAHHHTDTHSYLVMEFVSGGDLFEAISEKGKFSELEAGMMVSDVSEALNYIHCKSIVHRDLKPENLLIEHLTNDICRLKLGDFGLAMVVTEPVYTICGTPTYVAPEILLETGYGVPVDVWALGVLLYIVLCGFPPFRSRDRDQEELFQLIKQAHLHFLSPYWDPISEGDTYFIHKWLLHTQCELICTALYCVYFCAEAKHLVGKISDRLPKPVEDKITDNKLISSDVVPIYNAELSTEKQTKTEAGSVERSTETIQTKAKQRLDQHLNLCEEDNGKVVQGAHEKLSMLHAECNQIPAQPLSSHQNSVMKEGSLVCNTQGD
uniref:non-specific serine/threonine protein kinase n=1 Tax=Neogobius melanostomus TaxID=47308 RepID=A0A8C6T503_9GOBI